tara:strand:+ start:197 stop:868 length:672 start_codon:yes stop_codon:yes gene_type:complete
MSYKVSIGSQVIGDLKSADDAQRDTLIDFGEDQIDFQTSGTVRLQINNTGISALNSSFTGSLHGTASVATKDQMGETIVGGIYEIDQGIFQNPNQAYNPIYFPSDDSYIERVGPSSVNYFIAPFNGELIKIQVKSTTDFTSKALTASLHIGTGTTNAYSSTPATSLSLNGQAANTVYTFDFTSASNTSISVGNIFGFSLELQGGYAGDESIHFTTVVKYNPYA